MFLAYYLHSLLDTVLSYYKIIETREVGWITIDRQSGQFKREQQPLWKKFKLLLLFNPLTEWIDRTHWMRLWTRDKSVAAGGRERQPRSHREIKGFIDFYQIDMSDFSPSDPEEYPTFEDFFVRKHASHARPIYQPEDRTKAIVVTDARVAVFPSVTRAKELWIKGSQFTIGKLIEDEKKADTWNDGAVASFRLSPQDYHRYHSPVAGKVKWYKRIPGSYLQVDPVALHSSVNILTENARCCVCIDSSEFGQVLFVAIGATDVGTVEYVRLNISDLLTKMMLTAVGSTSPCASPATMSKREKKSAFFSSGVQPSLSCSRMGGSGSMRICWFPVTRRST
ncbi:hypothetical protein MAP00_002908 [Monascus purpureus]|nr:hypothetical protein MAP00_002908 [Monascus purpureus]